MFEEIVPAGIKPKLLQSSLSVHVHSAVRQLEEHFKFAGAPFFKEYTDHSFQHCIDVFRSACDILTESAFEVISSEDLNVLLLSCVLHDAGLHVTEDVFLALTDSSNSTIANPQIDKKSWPDLWEQFLAEAKRFNAKKLVALFGDSQEIREPPRSALEITQRDRLLIGEFLRKHHARYGHDLARNCVPNAAGGRFILAGLDEPIRDISGLIARSHGVNLRSIFEYVASNYDLRDYNRLHIIFLMVLLRIADFMQIQSARAPLLFMEIHKIRSPFSLGEWRLHQCITNVNASSLDPEAISISAQPKSVHEYLRFEQWLTGLQQELDQCWAILGEVYGRFTREALDKLQLRIRRIRSNIEDKTAFEQKVKFVPERVQFSVSEPELLRLLMEPLYGDNPLYGLRELTQNASDSVIELKHIIKGHAWNHLRIPDMTTDIAVEISEGPDWSFIIRDRGIGMTLDIIKNYFLKAGASFRNSELWRHDFLNDEGKSKIARTGRFGVGALSAFLIGEKIEVRTRHYTEDVGYEFECNIDEDEIEIARVPAPIGTTIKISSSERNISKITKYLKRDRGLPFYYILNEPSIEFKINNMPLHSSGKNIKKRSPEARASQWIEAETEKYEKVLWDRTTVTRPKYPHSGFLYCNGIVVGDIFEPSNRLVIPDHRSSTLSITPPTVAITDRDARLPIDLSRKGLSRPDAELSHSLQTSVAEHFLAELFASSASSPSTLYDWWSKHKHFVDAGPWMPPFLIGKDGFTLLDGRLFHKAAPSFMITQRNDLDVMERQIKDKFFTKDMWMARAGNVSILSKTDILNFLKDDPWLKFPNFSVKGYSGRPPFRNWCYMLPKRYEKVFDLAAVTNYMKEMARTALLLKSGDSEFVVLDRFGNTSKETMNEFGQFLMRTAGENTEGEKFIEPLVIFSGLQSKEEDSPSTFFSTAWEASFTSSYLPYDPAARPALLREQAPINKYL